MGILDKYLEEYQKDQTQTTPEKGSFVANVACTREVENHLTSSFSSKNKKNNISFAHTSNKCNNLKPADCDRCPAAGFWDYKGPGKWCFHRAYFLGKTGQPIPIDIAKLECPLGGGCKL